jgi:hypothetical protein
MAKPCKKFDCVHLIVSSLQSIVGNVAAQGMCVAPVLVPDLLMRLLMRTEQTS